MIFQQLSTCPQLWLKGPSCPQLQDTTEARLPTPFQSIQVIEKKEENTVFHRVAASLSTNPNSIK
jgi:hypothetical protein